MSRLLVTSMGSTAAQNLVHALRADPDSWWVLGGDMRAQHGGLGLPDAMTQLPSGLTEKSYGSALLHLAAEHDLDMIVPVMEPELAAACKVRDDLHAIGTQLLLAQDRGLEICRSKRRLTEAFRQAGMDTPALRDATGPYPVFVRPDDGSGSRGARKLEHPQDLKLPDKMVFTEIIEGPEFSVDGFADRAHHVRQLVARSRDDVRGGLAVRSTVVKLPQYLNGPIQRLSKDLGLQGFFNLQFKLVAERGPVCFDLNPRLGGAMVLSFRAGLDAPGMLRAWLGQAPWPKPRTPELGLQLHRRWHNVWV